MSLSDYLKRSANGDYKEKGPVEFISEVLEIIGKAEVSENEICDCPICDNPSIVGLGICPLHARQSLGSGNNGMSLHCREENNTFLTAEEIIEGFEAYGDQEKLQLIPESMEQLNASVMEVLEYMQEVEKIEGLKKSEKDIDEKEELERELEEESDSYVPRNVVREHGIYEDSDIDPIDVFD